MKNLIKSYSHSASLEASTLVANTDEMSQEKTAEFMQQVGKDVTVSTPEFHSITVA